MAFPLFISVSILWGLGKLKKRTSYFLPRCFIVLYAVMFSYIAEKFYGFGYKEIFVLCCIFGAFFVINLRRNFTPINILLSLLIFVWGIFSYLGEYKELFSAFQKKEISNVYAEKYVTVHPLKNLKKRNVIIVFVESFNENYKEYRLSDGKFLSVKDEDAVRFSNFIEGYAQKWTQGALFSALTGTHIHYISDFYRFKTNYKKANENNKGKMTIDLGRKFDFNTPHIESVGKISKQAGYQNLFVQGSSITFSGTRQFLINNGFEEQNVFGGEKISFLEDHYPSYSDVFFKYFNDYTVYTIFKDKVSRLDDNKPFLAIMFTYELHHQGAADLEPDRKIRERTIIELNDFIEWFKQQDFYENTTLVVIGDHRRMGKRGGTEKKIYNAFFNLPEELTTNLNTKRTFNQIDMFPTILEIMGFELPERKAGMGVSLFSRQPTLAEKLSYAEQEKVFNGLDEFYYDLW